MQHWQNCAAGTLRRMSVTIANTSLAKRLERQPHKRLLSAIGDLYLDRNLMMQMTAIVTLLTEILAIYRADGCGRVRLYIRRLDDESKEN